MQQSARPPAKQRPSALQCVTYYIQSNSSSLFSACPVRCSRHPLYALCAFRSRRAGVPSVAPIRKLSLREVRALARDHVPVMTNGRAKPACLMRAETLLSVRTGLQAQVRLQSPVLCRGAQGRKGFCSRTPQPAAVSRGYV